MISVCVQRWRGESAMYAFGYGETAEAAFAAFWENVWRVALDSLMRPYVECCATEKAARLFCAGQPDWQKRALARLAEQQGDTDG